VTSRFLIDLRLGPRTLESAAGLLASVACCCAGGHLPLLLVDNHSPYPAAILQVFGVVQHRRRRGPVKRRRRQPGLKAPPGLLVGVVQKIRDATGNLLRVRTRRLFGPLKQLRRRIRELGIGQDINTAHVERLNGTLRGQIARLARRTRNTSRRRRPLQWALWLWRDLYNWVRPHGSLDGRTPAMALGLAEQVWTVRRYVQQPVHLSDLHRELWAEQRESALESALETHKRKKRLPTS
jgi:hypothetical protein